MMTERVEAKYVVAGNWNQYMDYCKKKAGDDIHYIYVTGVERLRGLSEISGVFVGTFHERLDIEEIKTQIQIIKSRKTGFTAQTVASLDPSLIREEILRESMKPSNRFIPSEYITKVVS